MSIPAQLIVSHHSPFFLLSIADYLVLKIPNAQVAAIQKTFATQRDFEDVSASLPRHYAGFRAGEEEFLPKRCPIRFQAGRFRAFDSAHQIYLCRFLFDRSDPNFTTLYLSSFSPLN